MIIKVFGRGFLNGHKDGCSGMVMNYLGTQTVFISVSTNRWRVALNRSVVQSIVSSFSTVPLTVTYWIACIQHLWVALAEAISIWRTCLHSKTKFALCGVATKKTIIRVFQKHMEQVLADRKVMALSTIEKSEKLKKEWMIEVEAHMDSIHSEFESLKWTMCHLVYWQRGIVRWPVHIFLLKLDREGTEPHSVNIHSIHTRPLAPHQ